MKTKKPILLIMTALLLSVTLIANTDKPVEKKFSLKDIVFLALKNNLDIKIQQTSFKKTLQSLKISETDFIPIFSSNFSFSERNNPNNSIFETGDIQTSNALSLNLSIEQKLPLGGTLSIKLNNDRNESNSATRTVNPSLGSRLEFSLSQPLLKNFGTFITRRNILISINDFKKAELDLKNKILEIVYNVEDAYWNLVYAHQNLKAKTEELANAKEFLKQNRIKVKVGTLAKIDVLDAEASMARAESSLLQAEKSLLTAEENLKKNLNLQNKDLKLIPTDSPNVDLVKTDMNTFLLEALQNRPDILKARLDLKNKNINVRYFRNQMLPDLQLQATYYTTGQGGTEKQFSGNPFFDPNAKLIGSVTKDIWASIQDTIKALYQNYSVSLNLKIPLSFKKERAQLTQARLDLENALLTLKKTENLIYSEIKEVIKEVESNQRLVRADEKSLALQKATVRAEEKKYTVGLSTNYDVVLKRKDLSNAQTSYLNSLKNYAMTIAKINRYLGKTFEKYNIKFQKFTKGSNL
jgi:outer membrane protein TolC